MKPFITQENRIALHKLEVAVKILCNYEKLKDYDGIGTDLHSSLKLAVWDAAVEVTKQHRLIAVTTHEFETIKRCVPPGVLLLRTTPTKLDAA